MGEIIWWELAWSDVAELCGKLDSASENEWTRNTEAGWKGFDNEANEGVRLQLAPTSFFSFWIPQF